MKACLRGVGFGLVLMLGAGSLQAAEFHRFAVLAGNDDGSAQTRSLRYAREDARKLHAILLRLGGLRPDDAALVLDGRAEDFLAALGAMERRVRDASLRGERTALFVYYSGHARDGALLMNGSELPFASLKSRLTQSPADVRIAVFDACRSGGLTRSKGARRAPSFEIEATPSRDAKGLVILTSSAADEDSQESDEIGGSYFSHHLASGLLGDADRSGDGRVSLSEAYAYAYDRTVADTAESAAGAQHPTFSYDLAGNGDVVMTDLQRPEGVVLAAGMAPGLYYLVDGRGLVAAEVFKPAQTARKIALAPGRYRVKKRLVDHLRVGELEVVSGRTETLDETRLRDAPFSDDPVKGLSLAGSVRWSVGPVASYQYFFAPLARSGYFPPTALFGAELGIENFLRRSWDLGFDLGGGLARSPGFDLGPLKGLTFSTRQLTLGGSISVRFPLGTVSPFVGGRLAYVTVHRAFDQPLRDGTQDLAAFTPGLFAGVSWEFLPAWALAVRARVHYLVYPLDGSAATAYSELGALVTYSWESPR